jgi:hypothetical protein
MGFRARLLPAVLVLGCSSEALVTPPSPESNEPPASAPTGTVTAAPTGTAPPVEAPSAEGFSPVADYPAGPYGRGLHAVMEDIEFLGWRDPLAANYAPEALHRVRLSDFYDPTGTDIKLIVMNASALWCGVCESEMRQIKNENLYERYRAVGVEFIGTLFEDFEGAPAKPVDLKTWGSARSRTMAFPLVLDPSLRMGAYFTSDATPLNLLIDARTMKIVHVSMGYDGSSTGFWSVVDRELRERQVTPPQ